VSLVECVPNFSEGRDPAVIAAIRDAIADTPGAHVLDVSSDPSHHRTVITFVASLEAAVPAAFAAMKVAQERIDLTTHQGEHPRIGATDVVPFIPLEGATMEHCVALARELGARASAELQTLQPLRAPLAAPALVSGPCASPHAMQRSGATTLGCKRRSPIVSAGLMRRTSLRQRSHRLRHSVTHRSPVPPRE
jgi:hypothetical protein